MAQFNCEICGAGFEQKSRYERHMMTSHPPRATSAADVERAIGGANFPKTGSELSNFAERKGEAEAAAILADLPERTYRDAAEVARALGEIRSRQSKPQHQPSRRGGQAAMRAPSAAKLASVFAGIDFPASGDELKNFARGKHESDEVMQIIERFPNKTYHDMSDIAREIGEVK
ncbi:MAG: DUF2795 domain-containing protein [Myxococcota bacterium]